MNNITRMEVPIIGMDCAECTRHVQNALEELPGVHKVTVLLGAEKALIEMEAGRVSLSDIRTAVSGAGYSVPADSRPQAATATSSEADLTRRLGFMLASLFILIIGMAIFGEWLGYFKVINALVPFWAGTLAVLAGGYPVFLNVLRAARKKQVIAHTLMTLGVIAALVVGEWVTALIVVILMRVGDYIEGFTTSSARHAVQGLISLAPQTACIQRETGEEVIPASQVTTGEIVIIRPGEKIPVDGEVISGQAVIDQSAITGEALPIEVGVGNRVHAASLTKFGSLRVRAERAGADTTFGRVIRMVEEAEASQAEVQRFADVFSAWYMPLVAGISALTFIFSRNPLASAAVLLVACSCSISLATPIAMLASIGASSKRGILIKGGKYLELLAKADVLLVDKTGTLTLGKPQITDVILLKATEELTRTEVLRLAGSAERYSEHPLASAVRAQATQEGLSLSEPQNFRTVPGMGVWAEVEGKAIVIGNSRLLPGEELPSEAHPLQEQGKSLLFMQVNGELKAILAAADTLRPEVPLALQKMRQLGIHRMELLTGDNERAAAELARTLGMDCRANLLPEDKIAIVREYQSRGHVVVMAGDGINDAPALAQANVGIAIGAAATDIALESADIALMQDDWRLIPEAFITARRTMQVIRMNLILSGLYNLTGITLAACGILPPVLAAAAQSLPDLGMLGNSARLLTPTPEYQKNKCI